MLFCTIQPLCTVSGLIILIRSVKPNDLRKLCASEMRVPCGDMQPSPCSTYYVKSKTSKQDCTKDYFRQSVSSSIRVQLTVPQYHSTAFASDLFVRVVTTTTIQQIKLGGNWEQTGHIVMKKLKLKGSVGTVQTGQTDNRFNGLRSRRHFST